MLREQVRGRLKIYHWQSPIYIQLHTAPCMWGPYLSMKKEQPKKIRRKRLWTQRGTRTVLFPPGRMEKHIILGTSDRLLRRFLPDNWSKITPKFNSALLLYHKALKQDPCNLNISQNEAQKYLLKYKNIQDLTKAKFPHIFHSLKKLLEMQRSRLHNL